MTNTQFILATAMKHLSNLPLATRVVAMTLIAIAPALSANAGDGCDALYNASIKTLQTPHHVFSSKTSATGVKAPTGESIYAGGIEYTLIDGSWKRSLMTPQDMIEIAQEKLKTHPDTCTAAGNETIGGQAVVMYKVHNNDVGSDSLVRVIASSGLLLGQSAVLPGNARIEVRYEYTNVRAPVDVN